MAMPAPTRYTLRRILYLLTAAVTLASSGYAAVIAPLKSSIADLEERDRAKGEIIARMAGQMDALIAHFRVPYTPPIAPKETP